jgi:circadian clock protein KaiB
MTDAPEAAFGLTLFVSGASTLSVRAVGDVTLLLDAHLGDSYNLTVVDMYDDPAAGLPYGVLVAPTLVRHRPLPVRRHDGDLSRGDDVLRSLDLATAGGAGSDPG